MLYGINPDILVLGKALGNGYPISCVMGPDVMQAAQTTLSAAHIGLSGQVLWPR